MMKKLSWGIGILAVVAVLVLMVWKRSGHTDASFQLIKVERGTIIDKALAIGSMEPKNEIAIKSKISGLVKRMYVEIGDSVKIGDPLIEVAPDPTPLEYAESRRNVELAAVAYDKAKRDFDRKTDLLEQELISVDEFERFRLTLDETNLRMKLAEEKLALIVSGKTEIAGRVIESILRSPINGRVLARHVDTGDPVVPLTSFQEGTELLTLATMDNLLFKGTVDEIDVGKLTEGMPVDIKIGALPDATIKGILYKISPKARKEDNTILFDVEIHLTEQPENMTLRAGYSANAEIVINKKDSVLVLPERLVSFRGDSAYVEITNDLGEPLEIAIVTGLSDGLQVEVISGLEHGQDVVERPPKTIE